MSKPNLSELSNTIASSGQNTNRQANPASETTVGANHKCLSQLPFSDNQDYENASRGFIGTLENGVIRKADGSMVLELAPYDFL